MKWIGAWIGLLGLSLAPAQAQSGAIRVLAGELNRRDVLVELPALLAGPMPGAYRADKERVFEVQQGVDGSSYLLLDHLAAGDSLVLEPAEMKPTQSFSVARDGKTVVFHPAGLEMTRPMLTYQAEPGELPDPAINESFRRGGYLHPLVSHSGQVVSADFPPGHLHHHGVWFAWTNTRFQGRKPDFWNMGAGKGKVEFVGLESLRGGALFGELEARHRYVDTTVSPPVVALNEVWQVRVLSSGRGFRPWRVFDLTVRQECATADPLILPEYHYGGLGFRGNESWNGAENLIILTSEGETDRVKANASRARWCYVGGLLDGRQSGVVILGHPGNFRAPQPIRVHPGEPFFCFAPSQLGEWRIDPGTPYVSRYRFIMFDGPPNPELIEDYWKQYAQPVTVVPVD